ncbi:trimeric intracellular cation channel family protein [Micrococcus cohnii]|uniref:Putative membrane protein YeiH n=1 Tax=Micrococcus cohnii TaxID=993416 RepID=A0A7W7M3V1_9MICC|nr:TRIC cation channel family protein [Micrococcus cohnii]MBB4736022.1 putative membrane protein YeiH [Micrococcus cohnii]
MEHVQSVLGELPWLMTALDLIGVFFFATSGALLATRKGFDLVGSVFLSLLAGLGGGVTRDVLLDRGMPASLENPVYLIPPLLVALLVYIKVIHPNRLILTITVFDAGGLALFTVTGAMVALEHGANPAATVVIASLGALGGGLLRDIVANEVPSIFDPRGVYVVPTVVGAVAATWIGMHGHLNAVTGTLIATLIFTIRMAGYRYNWRFPGADISMDQDSIDRLRAAAVQAQEAARRRAVPMRRTRDVGPSLEPALEPAGDAPDPVGTGQQAPLGPREEYQDQVYVEDYDPMTQAITVVDRASGQVAHLDAETGVMDVTDPRTGWVRSYDDPEDDWVKRDAQED